ncbi:excinuclease ABC subunit UvrC [Nordella sp. HKS 07]|uniref:excinuclease ABC subunit UvrC n=1 Tax=Nordella sp. HKS 07 TaxID=2712222 RepID=UPI0013E15DA3|nr:excinuclease ABC subunit UvrC [Nordella sp. HKS 07]QIG46492.1 excinuclease ABC subunit UvrC [Nordella sp. HKS 07]
MEEPEDIIADEGEEGAREGPGPHVIRAHLRTLPNRPGVYRMFDAKGDVLYVGKARSLRNRVSNYVRLGGHSNRIAAMISLTANMEFVTTETEAEALLLEANLIKKLRPRFNVSLRDDKSFPYILIRKDHEVAQIVKHRGARSHKGSYFGPFASAGAVNRTINALQKAFLLRSCADSVYENRTRPCLLYQIKRCSAPCTGEIEPAPYTELVKEAEAFLNGKSKTVKAELAKLMEEASERLDFESAARYRDRIQAMSFVTSEQGINPQGVEEADVFGLAQEGGQICIQVFFFRAGQNWGNRPYFPRADKSLPVAEVLGSFLAQFYDDKPIPPLILLSQEIEETALLEEALSTHAGRKVEIAVPQRGEKRALIEHAVTNAREAMGRKLAESSSQAKLLAGVARVFGLGEPPRRIEVYDNSHIQGAQAVGGMIVAGPEGFLKSQYRKFNIRAEDLTPGDDFGMMREVLTRRFSRLLKEHGERVPAGETNPDQPQAWPDLVLIDGGQGQLNATRAVLADLGIADLCIAGVAKGPDRDAGREHFYVPDKPSFMLEARDPVLYYIQRLRDEAHRFAIGSHRAKRARAIALNPLDEIAGIGPTRKKALLQAFGSAKAVARASLADLAKVEGVNNALAQAIYDHFHEGAL